MLHELDWVDTYSSKRWVISPHQVPKPRVIIMAEAKERKQRKALPTASTNADKKELDCKQNCISFKNSATYPRTRKTCQAL